MKPKFRNISDYIDESAPAIQAAPELSGEIIEFTKSIGCNV